MARAWFKESWWAVWFVAKLRVESAIDDQAEAFRRSGYAVILDGVRIDGFPFRYRNVDRP